MIRHIGKAGLLLLAMAAIGWPAMAQGAGATPAPAVPEQRFVHHVYFWLKNPGSEADRAKLIEGLRELSAAPSIRGYQIGVPADTRREVIDSSYAVSWLLFFDSDADQAAYQIDPIHLKFVERYSHLWDRVQVYDSVPAR